MTDKNNKQWLEKPGQQLQRLREEKGIGVEIVADQLRLDKKLIHAIESDDYDVFPATTYVRGYIRGYAKYLGIESAPLIRAFDQHAGDEPQLVPFASQPDPQVKSDDKHMRIITYAIIGVLVLSVGFWWKNWQIDPEPEVTLGQENEQLIASIEYDQKNGQMSQQDQTALKLDPSQVSLNAGEEFSGKQPGDFTHEYVVMVFSESPQTWPTSETENSDMSAVVDLEVTPAPEEGLPLPDIATYEADQHSGAGILVELEGVSWIQITDANDIRVYSGLAGPDERINVSGEPPFRIVLGKTDAITRITYNDDSIDLAPLTRGDIARFFVDQSGAYR